ncbi:unnamed protein product [Ectocarpus sp. CCAP 1310/34]|nr:unnamed protein product [Ectocarpus sp. CCAP 1310/34]
MVVKVGGSFAYLPGDGLLTFEDHVQTVGDLKSAIFSETNIPVIHQRIFTSGGRLCDDDSAILEAHKPNPDGGHKMFMLVYEERDKRLESGARRRESNDNTNANSDSNLPPEPHTADTPPSKRGLRGQPEGRKIGNNY